jgi:hypothetical protein
MCVDQMGAIITTGTAFLSKAPEYTPLFVGLLNA